MRGQSPAREAIDELVPVDLLAALAVTAALDVAVFAPVIRETPVRVPLGLVFACFVPGYVLVTALFPEAYSGGRQLDTGPVASVRSAVGGAGITVLERCLLAVACSVVLVPAVGYLLNFTRWGVRLAPMLVVISAVTAVLALVAWGRRVRQPPERRFRPAELFRALCRRLIDRRETNAAVTALLVGSLAFFALSTGYAVMGGSADARYSELSLLSADGEQLVDGNLSAPVGEPRTLQLGVGNHEGREVTYTVVVLRQQVASTDREPVVREQMRLTSFEVTVPAGADRTVETVVPLSAGESDRVVWLVYTDGLPRQVSTGTAPYHVHVWLSGTAPSDDGTAGGTQVVTANRVERQ
ncbi:DUF1616 domain-containing protein [Haloarcula sp. S1CR25-12]|uniref:DUF1616 domain-containing protein n=1 Tax=Haloarcula saliterrae TaxID=2950534 RepID=A0ABU2FGH1_9EURY|nr:DUF1616 domain-containing protein [Haloarcula sp. S1CR25-12]MDS0261358.1 DUF1616 domain-containing protein [Haloarcula sp. S1CR25-12]